MNSSKWIWITAAAAGAYALYEWLSSQCETVGSSFYGGSLCLDLFPSAAATVQIPTSVTPVTSVTSAQAQQLAAYGLPADAVPSSMYPSGNNCTVVNPTQSGYNPTSGAPFYSSSLGQYICGPSTLWQSMQTPALTVAAAPLVAAPVVAPAANLVPAPLLTGSPVLPAPPPATNLICPPNADCSPISLPTIPANAVPAPMLTGSAVLGGVAGLSANRVPYHLIHRGAA